jgi:uracil-DNA glycosylase family 4
VLKSIFSECNKCPLVSQALVLGETNCDKNLKDVEVLYLAEAPAIDEIKKNRPLVGKAGKIFRKVFEDFKLNQMPYYITNIVLCANIQDNKTVNPPEEAIKLCKVNWETLLKVIKPKLIVLMGFSAVAAFDLGIKNMTEARGKFYSVNGYKVFATYHPSYIQRNGGLETIKGKEFIKDFANVYNFLKEKHVSKIEENPVAKIEEIKGLEQGLKSPYMFKIPDWVLAEDLALFDIQRIFSDGKVLYILKTKDGKKKYHTYSDSSYYYYSKPSDFYDSDVLIPVTEVDLNLAPPVLSFDKAYYEGDVKVELKHSIDYYLQRKIPEPEISLNILYCDIEVFTKETREFPDPKKADSMINAISYKFNDDDVTVLIANSKYMDQKEIHFEKKGVKLQIVSDEKTLINEFAKAIKKYDPDLLVGWNIMGFDIIYIYNRMKKVGLNPDILSPYGTTSINPNKYGEVNVYGLYILDLLDLYKDLSQSVEESYKLGAIAREQLGEDKVEFEGSLDKLYMEDLPKFIEYSAQDTNLLYGLNKKLGHIDLRNELRRICSSTWRYAESTTGLIDPLCISYAKKMGLVCKNSELLETEEKLPGAYVRNPISGLHSWIVDFDFTSLYPSIIISTNCGPNTYIGLIDQGLAYDYIYKRDLFREQIKEIPVVFNPMKKSRKETVLSLEQFEEFLKENNAIVTAAGTIFMGQDKEISFFNRVLRYLLDSRIEYKDKMKIAKKKKDEFHSGIFNNIQWAYKILANSIYGVLGNHSFRFFKMDLAKTVTLTGQEVVKFSGYHLSNYMKNGDLSINADFAENYEDKKKYLVYQDTDSLFVEIGEYLEDQKKL